MSLHVDILKSGNAALDASRALAALSSRRRKSILLKMADGLDSSHKQILEANVSDMNAASASGMPRSMLERLELSDSRIDAMSRGIRDVAKLPDPVGRRIRRWTCPNGLMIEKRRVPIGVIVIIYESRPNVTADTAALCLKTANAIILRGGKEAMNSNAAILDAMVAAGRKAGLPENAAQLIRTTDRDAIRELVQLEGIVDLVIPRGGESLIRTVVEHSRVPVIKHYKGVCHTYIDASADIAMAEAICENAKCQRPSVCNAMEKMLVHRDIAPAFLPRMAERFQKLGVELRGDESARAIVPWMKAASDKDWTEEYNDLILTVGVVDSVDAAIAHINRFGSKHSDAIVTSDKIAASRFLDRVDSATVYVNASTRFTDGGEFGMGAEIGISTDKLHARGPMGLEELTSYKYVINGSGQLRT